MKKYYCFSISLLLWVLLILFSNKNLLAHENIGSGKTGNANKSAAAGCDPASSVAELNINNVRARIHNGGDMWWDIVGSPKYEIPKIDPASGQPSIHSLFAGALWFSGIDAGGQLKVAAQTYRQSGNDFWPGPLDANGSTDKDECSFWDKHFVITRAEVDSFLATGALTNTILNWPAKGNTVTLSGSSRYIDKDMAPFEDVDQDGLYDPSRGDYPRYDVQSELDCKTEKVLFGDQTIWWIWNDKGNIHTESGGEPIGLEIHTQAFAFSTSDEVNNMTFYEHTIYNKATTALNETYIGQWVDADLGNYLDDYVGCDVGRGLGICYNGDDNDEGASGYGLNPPSVGVDFFQGPVADSNDGIDNDRDGVIDEAGEQIIMAKFVYYNNDFTVTGNPSSATHYRNYLIGKWKDGECITWGGNGKGGTECTDFMFPGTTDPKHTTEDWNEKSVGNVPADRRFLQSSGAFTLQPGAVNKITIGVVWARASSGGALGSFGQLQLADDKAQALFDNCFRLLNGPDAPTVSITELDKEFILTLENLSSSNNFKQAYEERDPLIGLDTAGKPYPDSTYKFQGYQLYQVKDATVTANDLNDVDLAKLIFQCDVEDNIDRIVNFYFDSELNADIPVLEVVGTNTGIQNTLKVTKDLFALGDDKLVNFKKYYFLAVAYAHNNYLAYKPDASDGKGQKNRYLRGRRNIKVYTAIPHKPAPGGGGSGANSTYGDGTEITVSGGCGNGGNAIDLTPESVSEIVTNYNIANPVYVAGKGPIKILVYDPLKVPAADFRIALSGTIDKSDGVTFIDSTTWWKLINVTTSETLTSDTTIKIPYEKLAKKYDSKGNLLFDWGFLVSVNQVKKPGIAKDDKNGFIEASIDFTDQTKIWLNSNFDFDGPIPFVNWIRAGTSTDVEFLDVGCKNCPDPYCTPTPVLANYDSAVDPGQAFEKVLSGTIAPYRLCSWEMLNTSTTTPQTPSFGPAWADPKIKYSDTDPKQSGVKFKGVSLNDLASIDLVYTSDKTKWTKSVVVELGEDAALSEGGQEKMHMRQHVSVDVDGNPVPGDTGRGYFPGYAINVETGERLNIMYGEDSWMESENGRDMKWNPTSKLLDAVSPFSVNPPGGGKHWVYVMQSAYDGCDAISEKFKSGGTYDPSDNDKREIYRDAMWVTMPYLREDKELLSTDVKIRVRVDRPYRLCSKTNDTTGTISYTFNTAKLAGATNNADTAKYALDLIGIVPNPYYAYSAYETSQLDNRIKFINLPDKCTISIYTLNGTQVRQFKKDDATATYLDWDLKNKAGVPISSGIYVIFIDVPNVGQKVLKWFGVMRPIDLDTF